MADKRRKDDLAGNRVMVLLRYEKGWSQADLARETGISASQVSEYDRGELPIPRRLLERVADAAGYPRILLDPALRQIRSFRAAARGWSHARGVLIGDSFADLLVLTGAFVETVLDLPEPPSMPKEARSPAAEDREEAAQLWERLEKLIGAQRLAVVEELEEYQCWALCELVAAASIEEAASRPAEALELALLSQRIAELVPGPEPWRWRLRGYAGVHVSNACRVNSDLPAADVSFIRAKKLWEDGASGDPGLLNEAMVP